MRSNECSRRVSFLSDSLRVSSGLRIAFVTPMSRSALFAFIGLSLAANAALLWLPAPFATSPSAAPTPGSHVASPAPAPARASAAASRAAPDSAPAAARGMFWPGKPRTDAEFLQLGRELRAAGFPPAVVHRLIAELYTLHLADTNPLRDTPYWMRANRTLREQTEAHFRGRLTQLDSMTNELSRPSERLDPLARKRRYGDLSDERIDAIVRLERDYQEIRAGFQDGFTPGMLPSPEDLSLRREQTALLNAEKRADLAKLLTPAELEAYELRNSDAAMQVARNTQGITLDEREFTALFQARQAYDGALPRTSGRITPEQALQRASATADFVDRARAILPDDRFYFFLERTDSDYRRLSAATKEVPNLTPAKVFQIYQLQSEFELEMFSLAQRADRDALRAKIESWNQQLDTLLGAETAAAFRQTPAGRRFQPPRAPATSTTPRT